MGTQFRTPVITHKEQEILQEKYEISRNVLLETIFSGESSNSEIVQNELEFGLVALARFLGNGGEPQSFQDSFLGRFPWIEETAADLHLYAIRKHPGLIPYLEDSSMIFGDLDAYDNFHRIVHHSIVPKTDRTPAQLALGVLHGDVSLNLSGLSLKS